MKRARSRRDIFAKLRLTPGQLRAVAEYRFDDAMCLIKSGENARGNGAMYLGGFVIECLLKALLLERHPNLQGPVDPAKLSEQDKGVLSLLYSHELDAMLFYLPEVEKKLSVDDRSTWKRFRSACEQWTVYARYSPRLAAPQEAQRFLATVKEVKSWLREL